MFGYILSGLGIYYLGFYSYLVYKIFPNNLIEDIKINKEYAYKEL
jgi:hypothetical protein